MKTIWNVVFTHHREGRNVSCRCHFHSLGQSNLIFADLNVKTIWNVAFTHHREGRNVSCRCHWRSNRSSADNHSRWWLRSSRKNCWLLKKYRKQIYIAKLFFLQFKLSFKLICCFVLNSFVLIIVKENTKIKGDGECVCGWGG